MARLRGELDELIERLENAERDRDEWKRRAVARREFVEAYDEWRKWCTVRTQKKMEDVRENLAEAEKEER